MIRARTNEPNGSQTSQLGCSTPDFLKKIESDPEACFAGCYAFARQLLRICPPSVLCGLAPDRLEDFVHDLVLHCCNNDFRVLRRYEDRGRPFAAWLQLVARNRYLDVLRREGRVHTVPLDGAEGDEPIQVPDPSATAKVDGQVDHDLLLGKVRAALATMSEKCRLLLQGAAEGYKPRELVKLMGWPDDWNKKASDDLRECRRRLRRELAMAGVDPGLVN